MALGKKTGKTMKKMDLLSDEAFEKAAEAYSDTTGWHNRVGWTEDFRAGWQARGGASNKGRTQLVKYHKGTPYYQFAYNVCHTGK